MCPTKEHEFYLHLSSRMFLSLNRLTNFQIQIFRISQNLFFQVFVGPRSILCGHWYPLFGTSDDSAHEFQSQGGFIISCALLSFVQNNSQSHLWLSGQDIKPGSLTCDVSTIAPLWPGKFRKTSNVLTEKVQLTFSCLENISQSKDSKDNKHLRIYRHFLSISQ